MDLISDETNAAGSTVPVQVSNSEDCVKKRKHNNHVGPMDTSLFKAYNSSSSDGKISLQILKQPEKQHRARYHTEGSRGAVKDRGQNGFPSVQLRNYKKPATLQVFVGSDTGTPIPHLYYQACKVSGKNSTPCREMKKENTDVILIDIDPDKDGIVVCDCVGILKERHSDIEGKVPPNKRVNWKKKTTKCRIVFRTEVELEDGSIEILQAVTDTISCTQLPGTPEILKMSLTTCSIEGGEELWIIGKNFLKDTEVVFKEDGGSNWCEKVKPIKEFFSNNHLIVVVPPFRDPNSTESVVVTLLVKCGSKASEPRCLTLKPAQPVVKLNGVLPTNNGTGLLVNLNGNSASLVTSAGNLVAMQSCKEEPGGGLYSRPTILEHIEEDTKTNAVPTRVSRVSKKRRERKTPFSRTRELPDINTDEAMFDAVVESATSSTSLERSGVNWSALLNRHSRQTSADRVSTANSNGNAGTAQQQSGPGAVQSQNDVSVSKVQNGNTYRQHILIPDETTTVFKTEELSNQFMEESVSDTLSATVQNTADNTVKYVTNTDQNTVTSPTSHFENLSFATQTQQAQQSELNFGAPPPQPQQVPSGGQNSISKTDFTSAINQAKLNQVSEHQNNPNNQKSEYVYSDQPVNVNPSQQPQQQPQPPVQAQQQPQQVVAQSDVQQQPQPQPVNPSDSANNTTANEAPSKGCSLGIDNSGTESATISIKLPPSVLQNQKQLSTIVNTISKALNPQTSEPTENQTNSAETKTSPTATFSPESNHVEVKQSNSPGSQQAGQAYNNTTWQPAPAQSAETNWNTEAKLQDTTNWLGEDTGFENKRKRVSGTTDTLSPFSATEQTLETWNAQPTQQAKPLESAWPSAQPTQQSKSIESWQTAQQSQQTKPIESWQTAQQATQQTKPLDSWQTAQQATQQAKPLESWQTAQQASQQTKPIESWSAAQQAAQQSKPIESWQTQQATQQTKSLENWNTTATQQNAESAVESWTTQQVQQVSPETAENWNNQSWTTVSTVQDSHLTTTWTTEEKIVNSASNNTQSTWSFVAPSQSTTVNNTVNTDNSNDSEKCTKWENINAKPLDQSWSNPNSNDTFINTWNTTTNTSTNTWTVVTTAASELNATTTWTTVSKWATADLQQPMDSVGSGSTSTAAEMLPVNPKEVSPMDVDVANTNGLQLNTVLGQSRTGTTLNGQSKVVVPSSGNPVVPENLINTFTT